MLVPAIHLEGGQGHQLRCDEQKLLVLEGQQR
jgi:hypothetical protein